MINDQVQSAVNITSCSLTKSSDFLSLNQENKCGEMIPLVLGAVSGLLFQEIKTIKPQSGFVFLSGEIIKGNKILGFKLVDMFSLQCEKQQHVYFILILFNMYLTREHLLYKSPDQQHIKQGFRHETQKYKEFSLHNKPATRSL